MQTYALPATAHARLEKMVDEIDANQGNLIDPKEFEEKLDTSRMLSLLPKDLSEDDFIGILKLALLTECATDTYSDAISERGRQFNAPWLERFTEEIWKPDEYTHAEPFRLVLLGLGFSEAELQREIEDAQAAAFEHNGGDTPINVTTFGMVQEYLTDHWHGLIAKLLYPASPAAAHMANRVKQRETMHLVWYREMTAVQLAAQPNLLENITFELANFRLPGNAVAPKYQSQAVRWLPHMGADMDRVIKDLARHLFVIVNSTKAMGWLALDLADKKNAEGAVKPHHISWVLDHTGGWGYGLVGEAVMERLGLASMFKAKRPGDGGWRSRARDRVRTWLAGQVPISALT